MVVAISESRSDLYGFCFRLSAQLARARAKPYVRRKAELRTRVTTLYCYSSVMPVG